ncbi:MAG: hypothetical protein HGA23_10985, partial [Bacteroidales bacterium]|nr:hypothetical protein [Bacteroidales bacterium]
QKSKYSPEELKDKFLIGVLHQQPKEEFTAEYQKIIEKYQLQNQTAATSKMKAEDESEGKKQTQEQPATED